MESKIHPEESYGDDFARNTYTLLVKRLKIDPIIEGRMMKTKINEILNPEDLMVFSDADKRDEAARKANNVAEVYVRRAKIFWRIFQLYCFNRGQIRALTTVRQWVNGSDQEINRLKFLQEKILNDDEIKKDELYKG